MALVTPERVAKARAQGFSDQEIFEAIFDEHGKPLGASPEELRSVLSEGGIDLGTTPSRMVAAPLQQPLLEEPPERPPVVPGHAPLLPARRGLPEVVSDLFRIRPAQERFTQTPSGKVIPEKPSAFIEAMPTPRTAEAIGQVGERAGLVVSGLVKLEQQFEQKMSEALGLDPERPIGEIVGEQVAIYLDEKGLPKPLAAFTGGLIQELGPNLAGLGTAELLNMANKFYTAAKVAKTSTEARQLLQAEAARVRPAMTAAEKTLDSPAFQRAGVVPNVQRIPGTLGQPFGPELLQLPPAPLVGPYRQGQLALPPGPVAAEGEGFLTASTPERLEQIAGVVRKESPIGFEVTKEAQKVFQDQVLRAYLEPMEGPRATAIAARRALGREAVEPPTDPSPIRPMTARLAEPTEAVVKKSVPPLEFKTTVEIPRGIPRTEISIQRYLNSKGIGTSTTPAETASVKAYQNGPIGISDPPPVTNVHLPKVEQVIQQEIASEIPTRASQGYKKELLQEISSAAALPKIQTQVLEWQPPQIGFQNPLTQKGYEYWNRARRFINSRIPESWKQFATDDIKEVSLERQRLNDALTKKFDEDIVKATRTLTDEQKKELGESIFKLIEVPGYLQGKVKQFDTAVGQLGKSFVEMSQQWVQEGLLSADDAYLSLETFMKELGEHGKVSYVRPPRIPGSPVVTMPGGPASRQTISSSMFKRKMTDEEWGRKVLEHMGKSPEEILAMPIRELRQIGLEGKKAFGWNLQGDYVMAKTFKEAVHNWSTMQWMDAIVHNPKLFARTAQEGMVPVESLLSKGVSRDWRLGPLNGGFIHPGLADDLELLMTKGTSGLAQALGEPLAWWKAFRVAGNPATAARNYVSGGMVQTDFAGYPVWTPKNAKTYLETLKEYKTKTGDYLKARDAGQFGGGYFDMEISPSTIKELGYATNPMDTYGAKLLENSKNLRQGLFQYYGHIDHLHRLYLFKSAVKDGASLEQAVHFANKWQLDYRFVPKLVEKARSGAAGYFFPFVSFHALMAPRVAEVMMTRPWVLAKYPAATAGLGYLGRQYWNMTKEEEVAERPQNLKDSAFSFLMPLGTEKRWMSLDYTFPMGSWETGFQDYRSMLDMVKGQGLGGAISGVLNNYDAFHKRSIYQESDLPSVKDRKIMSYTARAFGPGLVNHVMNIWEASREMKAEGDPRRKDLTDSILRSVGMSTYRGGPQYRDLKLRYLEKQLQDLRQSAKWSLRDAREEEQDSLRDEYQQEAQKLLDQKEALLQ